MKSYNTILGVSLLLATTCMPASERASRRLGAIMGHLRPSGTVSTPNPRVKSSPASATQAYVERPLLRKRLQEFWNYTLVEQRAMAEPFVRNEHALKDTHYVFYHAHEKSLCLFQDFLTLLAQAEGKSVADFIPLRHWHNVAKYPDVQKFLAAEYNPKKGDSQDFDAPCFIKDMLLSTNSSVYGFGAHDLTRSNDEASLWFYWKNKSLGSSLPNMLTRLFALYNFDKKYIIDLLELNKKYLSGAPGSMIQILIPKSLVNKNVYACTACGNPADALEISGSRSTLTTEQLLNVMRTKPLDFAHETEFRRLQTRILFTPDMLSPDYGVKIIRHIGGITPEQDANYQQELKELVKEIFASSPDKKYVWHDGMTLPGAKPVELPVSDETKKEVALFFDHLTYPTRFAKAIADNDFAAAATMFNQESDAGKKSEAALHALKILARDATLEQATWLVNYCKINVAAAFQGGDGENALHHIQNPKTAAYLQGLVRQKDRSLCAS